MSDIDTATLSPDGPAAGNATAQDDIYRNTAEPGDTDDEVGADVLAAEAGVSQDGATDEGGEDDGYEDYEYEGKKYRTHRDLKKGLMLNADYTRKTQEIAETRRALDARQAEITQQAELANTHYQAIGQLHQAREQLNSINARLAKYNQINWQQVEATDFQSAQTLLREQTQLVNLRDEWVRHAQGVYQGIAQAEQQRQSTAQQEFAKRVEEGKILLNREIRGGFNDAVAATLRSYAHEQQIPEATIHKFQDDPHAVRMLWKAHRYDQLMNKHKSAARLPTPSTPEPRPAPQVGRRPSTSASALNDRMSPEAWVQARERQIAARRR